MPALKVLRGPGGGHLVRKTETSSMMKKTILSLFVAVNITLVCGQVNTEHLMRVGNNAMYFNDYVLAIQYFNKVINAKPYIEQAYMYRAFAKISLEDYNGALDDLNHTIEKNQFIPHTQ